MGKEGKIALPSIEFEEPPEGALIIKTYGNTSFVNVMLEKKVYEQLEEKAKKLETTTSSHTTHYS